LKKTEITTVEKEEIWGSRSFNTIHRSFPSSSPRKLEDGLANVVFWV